MKRLINWLSQRPDRFVFWGAVAVAALVYLAGA